MIAMRRTCQWSWPSPPHTRSRRRANDLCARFRVLDVLVDSHFVTPARRAEDEVAVSDVDQQRAEAKKPPSRPRRSSCGVERRRRRDVRQYRRSDWADPARCTETDAPPPPHAAESATRSTASEASREDDELHVSVLSAHITQLMTARGRASTHALCPPRPIAFESATSTCTCRASFGT